MLINAYSTTAIDHPPGFAAQLLHDRALLGADGREDPEMVEHLRGFAGYVHAQLGGEAPDEITDRLLAHIEDTKRQYSLVVDDPDDFSAAWGFATSSILFLEDGTVTDPWLKPLLPGTAERGQVPQNSDARERALTQRALLAERGIDVADVLPCGASVDEARPQAAHDVALRFASLVLLGNGLRGDQSLASAWPRAVANLTPEERRALSGQDHELATTLSWRVEAATELAWALGLLPLTWPDEQSDHEPLVSLLTERGPEERFLAEARLRPLPELLDEQERSLGMLWRARQDMFGGEETSAFDTDVAAERAYAMCWVTDAEQDDWDYVETHT